MTELPDEAIEAFLLGYSRDGWEGDDALASLDGEVLIGATGPAPSPSRALRAFFGEPDAALTAEATQPVAAAPLLQPDTVAAAPAPPDRGSNVVPLFRRLRLTVGIAAAAGVAAAALTVAGTTGALPEPVMQAVSWVVEAVTPFELHEPARTATGGDEVPRRGPAAGVPGGSLGTDVGQSPAGPGGPAGQPAATAPTGLDGGPGQPAVTRPAAGPVGAAVTPPAGPPTSTPAGGSAPVQPPAAGADRGGQSPPAPPISLLPASPMAVALAADARGGAPPTTSDVRAGQAPVGGTVPSTVAGPANRP
jgi:hypothetical protein